MCFFSFFIFIFNIFLVLNENKIFLLTFIHLKFEKKDKPHSFFKYGFFHYNKKKLLSFLFCFFGIFFLKNLYYIFHFFHFFPFFYYFYVF
jgi:hypothetical protein